MAVLKTIDQANNVTAQTITTTTETIIVTSPLVEIAKDNGFILICPYCSITAGTNSTAVTMRVRRGTTLSGTIIGNPQALTLSANNPTQVNQFEIDPYALAGQAQYNVTVQLTGASANSTVNEAAIIVFTF